MSGASQPGSGRRDRRARVRRAVLLGPLLALLLWAPAARAAGSGVVILTDTRVAQYREALAAAKEVLPAAADADLSRPDIVGILRRTEPSAVLAIGQQALAISQMALPRTPIVHCLVLSEPSGANLSGVRMQPAASLHLSRFVEIHPKLQRLGVIYEAGMSGRFVAEARQIATGLNISLVAKAVGSAADFKAALAEMAPGIDGLWLLPNPRLANREILTAAFEFARDQKKAVFGFLDSLTQQGALASITADFALSGREAARLVLERLTPAGAKRAGSVLVAAPARISVNLKTAERLGIAIPARVLSAAHRVFR